MPFRSFDDMNLSLGNLQEEMNRLFGRFWHGGVSAGPFDGQKWAPFIDIYEAPEHYTLLAEVPGVDGAAVDVTYLGNKLTIRGEKAKPVGVGEKDRSIQTERRYGTFCRTIELPGDIDGERLAATCQGGVLTVTIPKSDTSKPKPVRIDVQEG